MNCLKNETIQAFLDNELAPEHVSQVKKHLKKCSICRAQLNSYKKDLTTIKNHLANQIPAEKQVIVPPFRKPTGQPKNIWPKIRIYAVAAAIATLISFTFIIRQYKRKADKRSNSCSNSIDSYFGPNIFWLTSWLSKWWNYNLFLGWYLIC